MSNRRNYKLALTGILFTSIFISALFFWDFVFAQIPQEIFLQARVTKKDKTALAGPHEFTFRLYSTAEGGTALWSEKQSITPDEMGIISCYLGSATGFPDTLDFNSGYHLSIEVDGEGEMSPRLKIASSAHSLNSYRLGGIESNKYMRSDIAQTMSGPFTLTSYFMQNYTGIDHDAINITYAPTVASTGDAINITAGANVAGSVVKISHDGTGDFIDARAGGSSRFKVDINGNLDVRSIHYEWPSLQGGANTVLTNDGSGNLTWSSVATGSSRWSELNNPSASLSLSMGSYTTTFTYGSSTGASNLFTFTDSPSNSGTGYLLNIATATGSTLNPIHIRSAGTEAIAILYTGNVGIGTTSPSEKLDILGNLKVSGTASVNVLNMNSTKVINLATPTSDYDAATKKYVDDSITGSGFGDISAVGDVTSGAAFTGTKGNVLYFEGTTPDDYEIALQGADATQDRTITLPDNSGTVTVAANWPLSISSAGVMSLGYNSTNLKLTSNQLNTIQDIATTSSPTFGGLTLSGLSGVLKATAGVVSGSATTTDLPEGSNLYYTDTRARLALSSSGPITYNSGTGVIGLTTPLASTYGGTGQNSSSWSGLVKVTSGAWSTASGGTDYEYPLTFDFPLKRSGNTISLDYNSTNLKLTSNQLNTIQDISSTSSPTFLGITTTGASYLATDSGNIGIGTTSTSYKLDVSGDIRATSNIYATNFYGNIYPGYAAGGWVDDGTVVRLETSTDNVGIGTSSPGTFKLQVAGDIGPNTHNTYNLGSSTMRWHHLYLAGGSLHIGNDGNEATVNYDTTNNFLGLDPDGNNTNAMVVKRTSGNVGIGTTNPTEKLVVADAGKKSFQVKPQANYVSLIVDGVEVARLRQ